MDETALLYAGRPVGEMLGDGRQRQAPELGQATPEQCEATQGNDGVGHGQEDATVVAGHHEADRRGQAVEKPVRGDDDAERQTARADRRNLGGHDPGDRADAGRKRQDEEIEAGRRQGMRGTEF